MNYLYGGVAALILGLGGWSWYQSQTISSLRAENRTQAQTIESQQKAYRQLEINLEAERQAVEIARKNANVLKQKVETVQREIKSMLDKDACAAAPLPTGVADSIKRLRTSDNRQN